MRVIKNPERKDWKKLLARPVMDTLSLDETVRKVLGMIKKNGDEAVRKYTERVDHVRLDRNIVSKEEKVAAVKMIDVELKDAIKLAS